MTMLTTQAELLIDMIEVGAPYSDDAFLSVQLALADHITKHGGTREIDLACRLADARLQSFRHLWEKA